MLAALATILGVLLVVCVAAGLYEFGRSRPGNITLSLVRRAQENPRDGALFKVTEKGTEPAVVIDQSPIPPEFPASSTELKFEALSEEDCKISSQNIKLASSIVFATFSIVLQFSDDVNVLPAIHEYFVLIGQLIHDKVVMNLIEADVPWIRMKNFLNNNIISQCIATSEEGSIEFPHSPNIDRPLPEDYARQGLPYERNYVTQRYLQEANLGSDEQGIEAPSMAAARNVGEYERTSSRSLIY